MSKPFMRIAAAEGKRSSVDNPVSPEDVAEARETISAALRKSPAPEVPATNAPTPLTGEELLFNAVKDTLIDKTGSPGLTSFSGGKVSMTLSEWGRLVGLIPVPAEVPADEGTLDEVLVEGSWFKREELPTILGNFMRALDESQRREKELIVTLTELRPVRDADTETLFATELQKARAEAWEEGYRKGHDDLFFQRDVNDPANTIKSNPFAGGAS